MFSKHSKKREVFTWRTKEGSSMLLKDMDTKHIQNCINLLDKHISQWKKAKQEFQTIERYESTRETFQKELLYRRWIKLNRILKEDDFLFESDKLFEQ